MRTALLTILAIGTVIPADATSQNRETVVGTWRLVSASASTSDGRLIAAPFGTNATGVLTYTPEGRMMAMISHGGRRALSGDRVSSPAPERAEAFATFFAYAGRYSVSSDKVIHHVEISSVQNWVGTDLVRVVTFDGNRMVLRTPPLLVGGTMRTTDLIWERVE